MTTLVDVKDDGGNLADLEKEIAEAAASRRAGNDEVQDDKDDKGAEPALPTKLRGKSMAELAEMYQNLESEHGRMGNELGSMRQLADRLLDLKRAEDLGRTGGVKQPAKVEVTAAELLEKPTEALDRHASNRESALESRMNDRMTQLERNVLAGQFATRHPDAQTLAKSTEFNTWVGQSRVRQRAAATAAAGDFVAADDLLTEFKAQRAADDAALAAAAAKGKGKGDGDALAAARRASLESGAGGDPEPKAAGKIYSRAAMMRLRLQDPEKYYSDEYQSEIQAAYAENRVK